jgi:hypothetical protein
MSRVSRRSQGPAAERVLRYLLQCSPATRSSIAAATGLPVSTVNTALKPLLARGEVVAVDGPHPARPGARGRPGALLSIARPPVALVDVRHESLTGMLLRADGTTLAYASRWTPPRQALTDEDLLAPVHQVCSAAEVPVETIGALVVTVPRPESALDTSVASIGPVVAGATEALVGGGSQAPSGPSAWRDRLHVRYATDIRALGELSRRSPGTPSFVFVQVVPRVELAVVLQGRVVDRSQLVRDLPDPVLGRSGRPGGSVRRRMADDPDAVAISELFHGAPSVMGARSPVRDLSSVSRSVPSSSFRRLGTLVGERIREAVAFLDVDEVVVDGSLGALMAPFVDGMGEALDRSGRARAADGPLVTSGLPLDTALVHGALWLAAGPAPLHQPDPIRPRG